MDFSGGTAPPGIRGKRIMTEKPQKLDTLKTHEQLAKEEGFSTQQTPVPAETFTPRSYYGAAHQSREKIDEYIESSREGWN